MLRSLDIRDMLIIDRLELEFQPGLNVLTGETGAGKSILLDSLGFVLGWRGRADLVRTGAERGEVAAVFNLRADHPARAVLDDATLMETACGEFGPPQGELLQRVQKWFHEQIFSRPGDAERGYSTPGNTKQGHTGSRG